MNGSHDRPKIVKTLGPRIDCYDLFRLQTHTALDEHEFIPRPAALNLACDPSKQTARANGSSSIAKAEFKSA